MPRVREAPHLLFQLGIPLFELGIDRLELADHLGKPRQIKPRQRVALVPASAGMLPVFHHVYPAEGLLRQGLQGILEVLLLAKVKT